MNTTDFGFKCPTGGQWYACGAGSRFVGCCTEDPCTKGCVQGNIRSGGFNISTFGSFPDASCGSASDFYTCTGGQSFWGCCKSNPCAATPPATCPQGNLVPAFLERPEQFTVYAPAAAAPKKSNHAGAIGGGVGGGVLAILIGVLIFFYCRRKKQNRQQKNLEVATPMMTTDKRDERLSVHHPGQTPPPTYSSPNPNMYQDTPTKGHYNQNFQSPYQEYAYQSEGPQELPAETTSSINRYSELPAEASSSRGVNRVSELPASAGHATAELESPQVSPRPLQTEFSTDLAKQVNQGAGVASEERPKEKN